MTKLCNELNLIAIYCNNIPTINLYSQHLIQQGTRKLNNNKNVEDS